jgi:hypothetical protein
LLQQRLFNFYEETSNTSMIRTTPAAHFLLSGLSEFLQVDEMSTPSSPEQTSCRAAALLFAGRQ